MSGAGLTGGPKADRGSAGKGAAVSEYECQVMCAGAHVIHNRCIRAYTCLYLSTLNGNGHARERKEHVNYSVIMRHSLHCTRSNTRVACVRMVQTPGR